MAKYYVFDRFGNLLDQVYFDYSCSEEYVVNSLINHDGFEWDIHVRRVA